jgi:hypothetical protein
VLTAALVVLLVAGACGTKELSVVGGTLPPNAAATATFSPIATQTPGSTASNQPSASKKPSASSSASTEATATAKATATATAEGTPGPSASGSGASGACASGSDPTFFVTAAKGLPFDVYCPVLPASWYIDTGAGGGSWRGGTEQWLQIFYKGPGGAQIALQEGAFCTGGASLCSPHDSLIGTAAFGDLTGTLDALGPDPSYGYAIYIGAGTRRGYTITGMGMTQNAFTAIAAALIKVAKP